MSERSFPSKMHVVASPDTLRPERPIPSPASKPTPQTDENVSPRTEPRFMDCPDCDHEVVAEFSVAFHSPDCMVAAFIEAIGPRTGPLFEAMEWMDVLYRRLDHHWQDTFRESYGNAIEDFTRAAIDAEAAAPALDVDRLTDVLLDEFPHLALSDTLQERLERIVARLQHPDSDGDAR